MQRAFDLTAAAVFLAANPKAESFIKAVRKFQSAISVSTDLAEVKKSVSSSHDGWHTSALEHSTGPEN